jgi:putative ABC transport system permease protein
VRHLLRTQLDLAVDGHADDTVLLPRHVGQTALLSYAVRIDPAMRADVLKRITDTAKRQFGPRMQGGVFGGRVEFYSTLRSEAFKSTRAALGLFAGITIAVVAVTLIGIMGLTGFWVQRRTRQIGIRRALGARQVDILRYFQAENALIVVAGIALGMLLAYAGNIMLMHYYELPRLSLAYLPIGAVIMLVMGQAGVLGPALRAAAVPPVVATRSV